MMQNSLYIHPFLRDRKRSERKLTKRRSSSLNEIKNYTKNFEVCSSQRKNKETDCLNFENTRWNFIQNVSNGKDRELEVHSNQSQTASPLISPSKLSDGRNRNKRSARPLKKLNAIDD